VIWTSSPSSSAPFCPVRSFATACSSPSPTSGPKKAIRPTKVRRDWASANDIPRITQGTVDQITSIATSVYNFDPLGVFTTANETDEKYTIKIDANISDNHRASLTYIHNTGTNQFTQNNSVSPTNPTLGFVSNGYELSEEFNSGVFQLNSNWTDNFSTEVRVAYRDVNRDQTPFGGREFAQFEVCLDPTSVGANTTCTLASGATATTPAVLATPRVFFGPDVSRQSNDLNTENLSGDFKATLQAGAHTFKFLAAYTDIDVFNLFLQRSLGDVYFDSIQDFQNRRASRVRLGGAIPSLDPNDAAARFSTQTYTFGIQDDWDVTDTLQLTIGARFDLLASDSRPALNPNFLNRYGFSNRSTFAGRSIFQPRIGFDWKPTRRLNVSGGVGVFGGGSPEVFLSNSFSNTGTLTNAIDISRTAIVPATPTNPTGPNGCNVSVGATVAERQAFCTAALTGITGRDFPAAVNSFWQPTSARSRMPQPTRLTRTSICRRRSSPLCRLSMISTSARSATAGWLASTAIMRRFTAVSTSSICVRA
jgi:hypothetical protein